MIFAKVDVKLRDHIRAHRAGVAMATWTWALLYSREQETDGVIYQESLRGSWVGEATALEHAAKLVEVGLWEVTDGGGWRICRYEAKNETKSTIDDRRRGDRDRKRIGAPKSFRTDSERIPDGGGGDSVLGIPGSGSGSGSDSGSPEGERERGGGRPPWFEAACDTVETQLPAETIDRPAAWLRYEGHRTRPGGKPMPMSQKDAQYWLTTVDIENARKDRRESADKREREARWDADRAKQRAGPPNPSEPAKLTDAEQRKFAEQLRQRMASRKVVA